MGEQKRKIARMTGIDSVALGRFLEEQPVAANVPQRVIEIRHCLSFVEKRCAARQQQLDGDIDVCVCVRYLIKITVNDI